MIDLLDIKDPSFLKDCSIEELDELAQSVRSFIIEKVSKTGGHLSSNLGVVDLTIALHRVFHSPDDKLIFDVGHQAYTHKILTGRAKDFDQLRQTDGLSGYLKRSESIHDVWEAGHSSTAIAAMAGFETARISRGENCRTVAVVGDGSLNSGLSFEALNFLGHQQQMKPIIILNDNEMSISKNVGTLAKLLNTMRTSKPYQKAMRKRDRYPHFLRDIKTRVGDMMRGFAKNLTIFDELGFSYYGPIDGHDIRTLIRYLELVKKADRGCVLHVVTKKGKGYEPAESDLDGKWHGVAPFVVETGLPLEAAKENMVSWSNIVSSFLHRYAANHPNFRVIVPAMVQGSALKQFQEDYPEQLVDVGICESFSVVYAAALALNHEKVFVPIYSSFLQRAYDQVSHDVARHGAHVVFGIDRAGLVGDDGETHQGIYDVAFLRHIPSLEILQPRDASEMHAMLSYALDVTKNPVAIRYSRAKARFQMDALRVVPIDKPSWEVMTEGKDGYIITMGDHVSRMEEALKESTLSVTLVNARFLKPLDEAMLTTILGTKKPIVVLEDGVKTEGLGSAILEFASDHDLMPSYFRILGLPDEFIPQGKVSDLLERYGLDTPSVLKVMQQEITRQG